MRILSPAMSRLFVLALLGSVAASAAAQKPAGKLIWGPVPPFLPSGAKMAVVSGDPMKAGEYALQLKMPGGYTIPAHQHPHFVRASGLTVVEVSGTGPFAITYVATGNSTVPAKGK